MKKFFTLLALASLASASFAQTRVRISGDADDGTTRDIRATTDGKLKVSGSIIIAGCDGSVNGTVISGSTNTCFSTPSATAYSVNQTIANSATAGSVVPMQFNVCPTPGGSGMVRRARVKIASDTGFAGQGMTLVLYKTSPTVAAGDHATFSTSESAHLGQIPVTLDRHFTDFEKGIGVPSVGGEINYDCATNSRVIYGLLYATGAITPQATSKAITVVLEAVTN